MSAPAKSLVSTLPPKAAAPSIVVWPSSTASGLSSSITTVSEDETVAVPSLTLTGTEKLTKSSTFSVGWSTDWDKVTVNAPVLVIATRITSVDPTLPMIVPVPTPVHVTAKPSAVRTAPGLPSVTVCVSPSTSVMLMLPEATTAFVESVGTPVLSIRPLASPSSDTIAVATPTTGASFVPKIEIVTVELVEAVPSLTVYVNTSASGASFVSSP